MAKKILVVDDERTIVKIIEIKLRAAGYEVTTASDGVEALEKVESERPDMVIIDDIMPRLSGWDVIKKLQENPATDRIPIIMLLGDAREANIFKAWQSGVSSCLTKPFDPKELLRFMQQIFDVIDR